MLPADNHFNDKPWTHEWWFGDVLGAAIFVVVLILAGLIAKYFIHRVIDRFERRAAEKTPRESMLGSKHAAKVVFGAAGAYSERREQRAKTLGSLAESVATLIIWLIVVLMILSYFGLDIGPLLASAGIIGVALGFGAQSLVKDFLNGIFMLLEDQYGVGDVVDMGDAIGTVEDVSLRITRVRDIDGTVWYVRNGEVLRVGNSSQDWARAVIDVGVGYNEDTDRVRTILLEVSQEMYADPDWSELILEDPEVWGVQDLSPDSVLVRLVVKTKPLEQWAVARQLRERIKAKFDAENIEIPYPQRSLWIRNEDSPVT